MRAVKDACWVIFHREPDDPEFEVEDGWFDHDQEELFYQLACEALETSGMFGDKVFDDGNEVALTDANIIMSEDGSVALKHNRYAIEGAYEEFAQWGKCDFLYEELKQ